jgi:hypothetical protein
MRHLFIVLTGTVGLLCGAVSCGRTEAPSRATSAAPSPVAAAPPSTANPEPTPPAIVPQLQEQYEERTVYDQPFDDATRLLIKAAYTGQSRLRVALVDRADATRQSDIDTIAGPPDYDYKVERIDRSTVVLCRTESYGFEAGCFKLFIDPVARRLLKRVAFDRQDVAFANDSEAQRLLGVSTRDLDALRNGNVFRTTPTGAREPPEVFTTHPMPQSTYQAFARARPARVKNGYGSNTKFEERIGAWQAEDGGFWFARTFYDGEGSSGVGAVGLLSRSSEYSFLTIPALFDWSVDVMLVEPDVLWAGLVMHGEGADGSGGLLRYDRKTHASQIEHIPGVILRIVRVADAVFLGTTHGLYVLRNGTIVWHHMEPDVSGRLVVITEAF